MTHRARPRPVRAVVAGLLLALTLTGCMSSRADESLGRPAAIDERVSPVWQSDQSYLSSGSLLGNRILTVAAGAEPGRLDLVGLDRATGAEVWRHPWSRNADIGFPMSRRAVEVGGEHHVVFLADGDEQRDGDAIPHQRLVTVKLSDGETQEVHPAVWTAGQPMPCQPDAPRMCLAAHLIEDGWRWLEIAPGTAELLNTGPLDGGFAHLYGGWVMTRTEAGQADPNESLGRIEEGSVRWLKSSTRLFDAPLGGSAFHFDIGKGPDDPALFWVDPAGSGLAGARLTAVSPKDGSVVWSRGAVLTCAAALPSDDERLVSVCFRRGEVGHPEARLVLALVDRRTGQVVRSHDVDVTEANLDDPRGRQPWLGKSEMVVTVDGQQQVLHSEQGLQGPFDPAGRLCGESVPAAHRFFPEDDIRVGARAVACAGEDSDRTLTRDQVDRWANDEGWVTLLRGDRLYAYRR